MPRGLSSYSSILQKLRDGAIVAGQAIQREDDRRESIVVRLESYERSTTPLIKFYERLGLLVRIDALGRRTRFARVRLPVCCPVARNNWATRDLTGTVLALRLFAFVKLFPFASGLPIQPRAGGAHQLQDQPEPGFPLEVAEAGRSRTFSSYRLATISLIALRPGGSEPHPALFDRCRRRISNTTSQTLAVLHRKLR